MPVPKAMADFLGTDDPGGRPIGANMTADLSAVAQSGAPV